MVVPTTQRQFYDTTKKESSLAAYSGAIREGAEAWGKLFDGQQKANMESLQIDAENEVKNEFARKSPEYDNNPDNPEFKQYMDDFRKQKYSEAREQVNPFYRGQFDALTRENDKRYNSAFDEWKIKQRQANASANVKKISQSMIDEAYLAGQTGDFEDAKAQYNKKVATIRNISTSTLGARATEQGIEDLNKQYLTSYATGKIESDPFGGDAFVSDPKFIKQVGRENAQKLKNYAKSKQNAFKKEYINKMLTDFNANPTKQTIDMLKSQDFVKISEKTLNDLESTYKESPNYICETDVEALDEVIKRVEDFVSKDYSIKDGEDKGGFDYEKQFADASELTKFIMTQNSKDGKLSDADRSKYMGMVAQSMNDTVLKNALMNTQGEFMSFIDSVNRHLNPIKSMVNDTLGTKYRTVTSNEKTILSAQVKATIAGAMERLEAGDEDGARRFFDMGKRTLIEFKNPEIRGKKVGDTFSKDGQTYQIMGFDDNDVNVRIIYN